MGSNLGGLNEIFSYHILFLYMLILSSAAQNSKEIFDLDDCKWFYKQIKITVRQIILPLHYMAAKI